MTTTICTITFRDGKTLIGSVSARFPTEDEKVTWTGDTGVLPWQSHRESSASLATLCRNAARTHGGTLRVQYEGDNWPDEADVIFAE